MPDYAPVNLAHAEQIAFSIDGRALSAPPGTMLVDAAAAHGIEIPVFCYEPRLGGAIGACRMCLVEVEGMRALQTACSTPVGPDMVVRTTTDTVRQAQDGVLELLLANHPLDCPVCDKGGECPLQDRTFHWGPGNSRFVEPKRHWPKPLDLSPLIALDRERCIQCFRCIRFSQDVAEDRHLIFQERGGRTEVATFTGDAYEGRFTGNVVDLCPVGALTSIPYRFVARPWDIHNAPSVCPHCPVGCNTELSGREGHIMRVTGRPQPNFAVEEGWLCDRGRWAHDGDRAADRLREPVLRDGLGRRRVPIRRALDAAALVLRRAARPAILLGPGATVEEGFVAQEMAARALPGGRVARLGIPGHALAALRALPGAQLGDLDRCDLIVVIGGDPANQQPVVELRVRKALRLGARLVTVGPRPQALDAVATVVRTAPGRLVEGLGPAREAVAGARRPAVLWDEADLAGEPDAAGAAARIVADAPAARQLELGADVNGAGLRALGIPAEGLLEALEAGEVDVLVTVHADPRSAPAAPRWEAAIGRAPARIAIATHESPVTAGAQIALPGLTAYEQEGVLVAMNGRAQRLRPAARGPRGAAPAWEIMVALTHALGRPLPYRTAAAAFDAAARARRAFAGMSYDRLGVLGEPTAPGPAPSPNGAAARREPAGEGLVLVPTAEIMGGVDVHRSAALAPVATGSAVGLSRAEAGRLGLEAGAIARLTSPHGACALPVAVRDDLPDGGAFVALGVPGAGVEALLPADRGPVRVSIAAEEAEA